MKTRMLFVVGALALALVMVSGVASAASETKANNSQAVKITGNTGVLAPGQSQWYYFEVPQAYSEQQYKRDLRNGVNVQPQLIELQFDNSDNPDLAHNSGFRLYDPYRMELLMNGVTITEPKINSQGMQEEDHVITLPSSWAIGSPEQMKGDTTDSGVDVFLGRPKVWQGVVHDAGTYYIEVYNDSAAPLSYTLTVNGWNMNLAS